MNIYLDNSATIRVRKEVISEMNRAMTEEYGNPSSVHALGEKARKTIDNARAKIAKEIGAKPSEIYFTSGATESNNLAILGLAKANPDKKTIVISDIEHPSVSGPCEQLKKRGYKVIKISSGKEGIVDYNQLERVLRENRDVLIVSIMHVNNVIGTVNDIERIGAICNKYRVLFHTDAVQSFGKIKIDVKKTNISLLSASGHKVGGPKGVGLLYIKDGLKVEPLVYGGGQEKGIRSGTENVPGIVGMAQALEIINKVNKKKIEKQRNKLIKDLEAIGGEINGSKTNRIYNNVNVSFDVDSDILVQYLSDKGIYVSSGSACESKKAKEVDGGIRIVLDETIGDKEINVIVKEIKNALKYLSTN
jgi:cysteine desulfurase